MYALLKYLKFRFESKIMYTITYTFPLQAKEPEEMILGVILSSFQRLDEDLKMTNDFWQKNKIDTSRWDFIHLKYWEI